MLKVCDGTSGSKGKQVEVEVNYFRMNLNKLIDEAFHYDLTFKPPGPKKLVIKTLDTFMEKFYANVNYGFDGKKNMYTDKKLTIANEEEFVKVEISTESKGKREFELKIQYTNSTVDLEVLKK